MDQTSSTDTVLKFYLAQKVSSMIRGHARILAAPFLLLVSAPLLFGQTSSLALSSGSTGLGGTVSLNLNLTVPNGAVPPVGVQWTLSYAAGDVASISVVAGTALTDAGKTVQCNPGTGSMMCLAFGVNSTSISSGVVAQVAVTLPSSTSSSSVPISVVNAVVAFTDGTGSSISTTGGIITVLSGQPANPMPSITSLSPVSATAGTAAFTLTVNGSGFINGSVVNWNGSSRTTTYVSGTQLQAGIAAGDIASAGTAQVTVFNPAPGGGTSGNAGFTINAPNNPTPSITSLSPVSATAGTAAFTLTVNGSGFINGSVVNWNGSSRTTTYVSGGQLQASISAADIAAAGTAQVTVFNPAPGGGTSGNAGFTINAPNNPAPSITSLSPVSATAGTAAFTLTVNGSGFINGSVVNWNGSSRTTTYVSGTQLQAGIAAGDIASAGTAQVTVFNPAPGGGTSGNAGFTINAPNNPTPSITSLSPASATAGTAAFTLTVNGSGFVNGSVVNWNGANRTTTYVNGGQLQAGIAAGDIASAGTAQVTVFNPTPGGGTSGNAGFTINAANNPTPSITSLSPASATAGTAAFTLTVNGSGFVNGSVVNWNGANRSATFVSGRQLLVSISAADIASAGTVQVMVFNPAPGGGTSTSTGFTINAPPNPAPSLTSLSPSSATAGTGAFTLTVNGNGFMNGSVVYWKGTSRTTTYVSGTQLQAAISTADIAVAGTAQVMVFNPAPGGGNSGNMAFTISQGDNLTPSITSLAPSSATAGTGAFTLTVNGNGFVNGSVVYWKGTSRTTTYVSGTQLQAAISTADIAVAGTAQVMVFNPAPGGGNSG